MKKLFALVLCLAMLLAFSATAFADATVPDGYPSKDVTIILPYGSGSSQEAILRVACQYVQDKYGLKHSFIISNKEGASGEIGLTAAYTAKHDGYTLAMFHSPHLSLDIVRSEECAFKYTDFAPICNFMIDPTCWYVNGKNAETYPDFQALLDAALANPGKISVACGGLNTSEGRFIQQVDGEFLPLVVGMDTRDPKIPDVPTTIELGLPIESYSMRSLAALADTPEDIYAFLVDAFQEAMASDAVSAKAAELGIDLTLLTPDEIQAKWDSIHASTLAEWETNPWQ